MDSLYYILPLTAAAFYALSSIFVKVAMGAGAGITRTLFISNWVFLFVVGPLWLLTGAESPDWSLWWVPLLAGTAAFCGALATFVALKHGDVSVATPLLGVKVLFVALLSPILLRESVPLTWWLGALMTAAAIYLLGAAPAGAARRNMAFTVLASMGAAFGFALLDIAAAGWAADFGFFPFLFYTQLVVALGSWMLLPFFSAPLREVPVRAWKWLVLGSVIVAGQFVLMAWTLSTFGKPTGVNILYGSRGLWSVLLIVAIGPLVGNFERDAGRGILARRLVGSVLLLAAITVVVLEAPPAVD
ncbi:MAG: DMT family transporter [Opitutales bacterium]|nr:DMT family transporter [Opitutales bacterium]